ncbi:hypothetical protein LTR08_007550 [Meristemomyces frigidus]|nr:hypothetical protein LTR08_007550 [Meristemomyces frigidus]
MPSTSPGAPTTFAQVLPGAPTAALQALATLLFRHKRYVAYTSGCQLSILSSPTTLVQALTFPEALVSIAADSHTGKLIVAGKRNVYVLEPATEGWARVWWERTLALRRQDVGDEARCLNWGSEGEVLVGGSRQLSLFSTLSSSRTSSPAASPVDGEAVEGRTPLWAKSVASPLQYAAFSPSASLIATCGVYDRLVKIWRRLSFEEGLFDHTYLSHPGSVTHLEWRPLSEHVAERRGSGISGRQEEDAEVLYTMANDGKLRVWRTVGLHDLDILTLHTVVDLVSAIPPSLTLPPNGTRQNAKPTRYAFTIPSDNFCGAVTAVTRRPRAGKVSHSLEHLKEVASKTPDVVVTMDAHGHMSAWGLQSIGHKRRPGTPGSKEAFHITHAEGLSLELLEHTNATYQAWFDGASFHILAHGFAGVVNWWQGDVETFFSPSAAGPERLANVAAWSGHSTNVTDLRTTNGGTRLLSRSNDGDIVCWNRTAEGQLRRAATSHNASVWEATEELEKVELEFHAETGLDSPILRAANTEVAALASSNGKQLVIVDLQAGYVEHRETFVEHIRHLRCSSSAPTQNFLAVGFDDSVNILVQGRYEPDDAMATWLTVKKILITDLGVSVLAVEWLRDGALALALGNGIALSDNSVIVEHMNTALQQTLNLESTEVAVVALPELARQLKQPLPVWHPSFLSQLVRHGKLPTALDLLPKILAKLKFWSEGEELSPLLGQSPEEVMSDSRQQGPLSKDLVDDLREQLEEKRLPAISVANQKQLGRVVEALAYVAEHIGGLDKHALCYLFNWKLQLLHMAEDEAKPINAQPNTLSHPSEKPRLPQMHWREIAFAYHSTTQQPLLDILTLHYDNKLTWDITRSLGITAWLADKEALEQVLESLAQSAYRQSSPPDPSSAALYFLALHKKSTLMGLWRIATWHREQRSTLNFLKRDFSLPESRTAAKKNAYALMGKRRFEYAAAFFLLADDAASAVSLLAGQCDDTMLAIAVARLYGGDGSPVVRKLLEDRLMPRATTDGDRWLMSWCNAVLLQRQEAAQALVQPLEGIRISLQDDPATLVLYRDLRKSSSKYEYEALLRAARILRRTGIWLLALNLIRTWEFRHDTGSGLQPEQRTEVNVTNGVTSEPPSVLDDYTQPSAAANEGNNSMLDSFASPEPVLDEKAAREAKAAELLKKLKAKKQGPPIMNAKKPEPTQFKEPDSNSLLDSFGF